MKRSRTTRSVTYICLSSLPPPLSPSLPTYLPTWRMEKCSMRGKRMLLSLSTLKEARKVKGVSQRTCASKGEEVRERGLRWSVGGGKEGGREGVREGGGRTV